MLCQYTVLEFIYVVVSVKEYKITAPQKELAVFEGCGHSPNYDDPEGFANLMKGLLES